MWENSERDTKGSPSTSSILKITYVLTDFCLEALHMKKIMVITVVVLILSNLSFASISGIQIGVNNLLDTEWRSEKLHTSGLTLGFILPVFQVKDYDVNFRMKLASHQINSNPDYFYSYNYNGFFTGSNEFLIGSSINAFGLNLYPQIGMGFSVDFFHRNYNNGEVYGMFFYDLSISFLGIFNREALGISLNYENGFEPTPIYPKNRLSVSFLFFKQSQ